MEPRVGRGPGARSAARGRRGCCWGARRPWGSPGDTPARGTLRLHAASARSALGGPARARTQPAHSLWAARVEPRHGPHTARTPPALGTVPPAVRAAPGAGAEPRKRGSSAGRRPCHQASFHSLLSLFKELFHKQRAHSVRPDYRVTGQHALFDLYAIFNEMRRPGSNAVGRAAQPRTLRSCPPGLRRPCAGAAGRERSGAGKPLPERPEQRWPRVAVLSRAIVVLRENPNKAMKGQGKVERDAWDNVRIYQKRGETKRSRFAVVLSYIFFPRCCF